jgi:hypothetical protein
VSAPAIIDEIYRHNTDSAYEYRRAKHSRPRRRYTLDYLGKTTHEMRLIRDYIGTLRGGTLPTSWWHPTAPETVGFSPTTPIVLQFYTAHGLVTNQMLGVFESPLTNAVNGFWTITRITPYAVSLNNSTSVGSGTGVVRVYLPRAIAIFSEDTMPSPQKLIGPEAGSEGWWNFTITLEEVFG